MNPRWLRLIAGSVFLVIAGGAAYHGLGSHDFIRYDDQDYVTANPALGQGLSWAGIRWAFTGFHAYNYHPVTWLTHLADYQAVGLWAGGHHLMSLAGHLATGVLLLWTLEAATGAFAPSLLVAGWFVLHPLNVESVAWVAERKNVVSTFFWVLTLAAYQGYVRHVGVVRYLLALFVFCLGLLSKQMLVTLPCVLLLWDFWPLGRIDLEAFDRRDGRSLAKCLGLLVAEKIPFFLATIAASALVLAAQGHRRLAGEALPLASRLGHAIVVYLDYLRAAFWPVGLAVFYPYDLARVSVPRVVLSLGILALLSLVVVGQWRQRGYLAVGWFWFLGTLVPVIGLVQVGLHDRADRYFYVPGIGLGVALAWLLSESNPPAWPRQLVLGLAGVASLIGCFVLTWIQVPHWKDSLALFHHTLVVTGPNAVAHHVVGGIYLDEGRLDEAQPHLEAAARLHPGEPRPNVSLAKLHGRLGRWDQAVAYYDRALATTRSPNFHFVYLERGHAQLQRNQPALAVADFERLIELEPREPAGPCLLGMAQWLLGQDEAAVASLERAIELSPQYALAHFQLGEIWRAKGQDEAAVQHLTQAWELDPAQTGAANALAWLLATSGDARVRDPQRATTLAEQLCTDRDRALPAHLDTLAVAYQAAGRGADALRAAQQAVNAARARGDERAAAAYTRRVQQLQAGPPPELPP